MVGFPVHQLSRTPLSAMSHLISIEETALCQELEIKTKYWFVIISQDKFTVGPSFFGSSSVHPRQDGDGGLGGSSPQVPLLSLGPLGLFLCPLLKDLGRAEIGRGLTS